MKPGVEELTSFLADHPDVEYVDAILFDLCGIVRGKRYPRQDAKGLFTNGMQIPYSVFLLDVTGDCPDAGGRGFSDGDPDGIAVPVAGTLKRVPWARVPSAQVLLTMTDQDGTASSLDPRNVLRAVESRLVEDGLHPVTALELEFYLIDRQRMTDGSPQFPIAPDTGQRDKNTQVYGMWEIESYAAVLRDIETACNVQGVPCYTASSEYAPGQFEVNLRHVTSGVSAADHASLLKRVVMGVAERHGFEATFMSKPFSKMSGNGLHIHLSLCDETGKNLFDDGGDGGTDMLRWAIGGMQATMAEAMAIFAPNANAYRRFQPNLYVPTGPTWGINNRSVAFRVPSGEGAARRVEHRICGADANPYLALAAVMLGAHHGIKNRIDPGPAHTGNAGKEMDESVPWTWRSALQRLDEAKILPGYISREYLSLYHETKWAEMEKFQSLIAPHEYNWYL
ncbi:glutamine synthetase family protein [Caenispirillum bisanense]|uniref:Glutamate--putrescine ligase n=1 Tax=Caenispirillum bisanense TaxID=414052 RepID=A0A286GHF3_9PROT|nr:glutamine synthetase family protein [Caenispirillum bisanense]SOD94940.1 glutamate--putrescine ligase [Caenispirillum bisanense]